jgi:hypothetical protein
MGREEKMDKKIIQGRGVIPGVVEGEALVCPRSITGWGGINPKTGVIMEFGNINRGQSIKDKILVLPGSKGSNGWSCYFGATRVANTSPKGWLFTKIDSSAGVASAVMNIPTIVDFDADQDPCTLISNGDWVKINGDTGQVEILKCIPDPHESIKIES